MIPDQPGRQQTTQRDLDPHLRRYAQRTVGMTASEIRALFAVASRPE
ncbi:MAG TPA: PLP-dependent aminotransferase family protein, partial [Pseudonocardiaceae bacterium]|nr:PLP-dependent aminotransferase family protein [Pseudonocardiaceae bacterium]